MRADAAFAERRIFRGRHEGARIRGRIDHRCDHTLGAEIEHAAHHRVVAEWNPHHRRRAGKMQAADRLRGRRHVPQAVLLVDGDGDETFTRDRFGDMRRGQSAPA